MSRRAAPAAFLLALAALALTAAPAAAACDPLDSRACLLPYPNDWFTVADDRTETGRRLAIRRTEMPRNTAGVHVDPSELNRNDGFSPGQTIMTRVPGLDLRRSRAVPINDLARAFDRAAPIVLINARTLRRQLIWAELDAQATGDEVTLNIHPARNLAHGERYIVALRNLKDARGRTLRPSGAFRRVIEGTAGSGVLGRRARQLEPSLRALERAGIEREELYLAWDFTVISAENMAERVLAIRDDAFAQLGDRDLADREIAGRAPRFAITSVREVPPCGADGCQEGEDDRILREVQGTVTVPCYLREDGCPPGSRFHYARRGDRTPSQRAGNVIRAPFQCNVPRAAQTRPARLTLYGHGLLGRFTEINARNVRDMSAEHNVMHCATYEAGMSEQDLPFAAQVLQDFSRFPAFADRLQQGMLNMLYLGRLMAHPQGLASHPAFRGLIQTRRLVYDGNSQGGIFGGALAAIAPDYTRAILGVPGIRYALLLPRSVDFDRYLVVMRGAYPSQLDRMLIYTLIQGLWDRGEGNGYANLISDPPPDTPAHRVLYEVALGDHQVAPVSAEIAARTVGARVHRPVYEPGRTRDRGQHVYGIPALRRNDRGSGLVIWDSGSPIPPLASVPPRAGRDSHEDVRATPANRVQKEAFLWDGVIRDVCGGRPCRAIQVD